MADTNIFERLKADHDSHRALLAKIGSASASEERKQLFEAFRIEVTAHAAAEEQTLYATMLADPELRHDAQHSVSEHKEVEDYFEEMEKLDVATKDWSEKFEQMQHRYLHHIGEEEEDMFPEADEKLADEMIEIISDRYETRKPAEIVRAEQGADAGDERE